MPNLLLDPSQWEDGNFNTPPMEWNGSGYVYTSAENVTRSVYLQFASAAVEGDTFSGTIAFANRDGDSAHLNLVNPGVAVLGTVPVTDGGTASFDFPAVDGARFILASSAAENTNGTSYYGLNAVITPGAEPPVQISYNCSCDDDYPRKTLLEMREYLAIRLGMGEQLSGLLPGVKRELNSYLVDAQEQIYRQYKVFRLERFFTWDMTEGVRFYDLLENSDVCTKKLDPRMITWVGISQDNNFWRPLVCGIKPEYYYGDITSWPQYYEIRQCIEVWPPPSGDDWKLRIKGYFGLLPLVADTDYSTVDYEAIQLFALANAKAHRGQPDAANYMQQYRTYIGKVTAGSHMTRRYVPGTDEYVTPPLPILTGYPGDP